MVRRPVTVPSVPDPGLLCRRAWESAPPMGPGTVTVVVNDATRPACAVELLGPVAGALAGRCRVLVATGAHEDIDGETKDALLPEPLRDAPWCTNDMGSGSRVVIGRTSRGTEVEIHPWLADGGPVLLAGSVEPHYFAGFTGGRKSVLPGCCSYRSIEDNHWLACMPGSGPAALEGNPVHEDMMEAADMLSGLCPVTSACCVVRGGRSRPRPAALTARPSPRARRRPPGSSAELSDALRPSCSGRGPVSSPASTSR